MSYGHPEWAKWALGEKEGIEHIKFAYVLPYPTPNLTRTDTTESEPHLPPNSFDHGINTFDTANVYSNGESERILGKALKVHKIPREEVVIMTKLFCPVFKDKSTTPTAMGIGSKLDDAGYVNRHGLSRKASRLARWLRRPRLTYLMLLEYLRLCQG